MQQFLQVVYLVVSVLTAFFQVLFLFLVYPKILLEKSLVLVLFLEESFLIVLKSFELLFEHSNFVNHQFYRLLRGILCLYSFMIQFVRFWLILFSFIFHEFLFWFLFNHGKVFFIGFRRWTDSIVLFFTSFSSEEEVFGLVFNLSWRVVVFFHSFSLGLSFKLAIHDSLFQDFLVFTALLIFRIDIIFCWLGFY